MSDEELQCCPFCGTAPRVYETQWAVKCGDSLCPVKPSVYSNDLDVATTRWNARGEKGIYLSHEQIQEFLQDSKYPPDLIGLIEKHYDKAMVQAFNQLTGEVYQSPSDLLADEKAEILKDVD